MASSTPTLAPPRLDLSFLGRPPPGPRAAPSDAEPAQQWLVFSKFVGSALPEPALEAVPLSAQPREKREVGKGGDAVLDVGDGWAESAESGDSEGGISWKGVAVVVGVGVFVVLGVVLFIIEGA